MINVLKSEALAQDKILLRRIYVDITGSIATALILSQIIYWFLPDKDENNKLRVKKNGKLYLVKRNSDWWNECRIKPKTAQRSLKELKKQGIIDIEIHKFSNTPMNHIWMNEEKLNQILESYLEKQVFNNKNNSDLDKMSMLSNTICPDELEQIDQIFTTDTTTDTTPETTNINGANLKKQNSHSINNFEKNCTKMELLLTEKKDKLKYYDIQSCKKILLYYLNQYGLTFNKQHPEIKREHWERVINDLFINPVSVFIKDVETEDFYSMVDKYFQTDFPNKNVDYNILHFTTEGILDNRSYELCYS